MIAWIKNELLEAKQLNKNKNDISFTTFSKLLVKNLRKFYHAGALLDVIVHNNLKIITININHIKKIAVYYNNIFEKLEVELVIYKNNTVLYSTRYPIKNENDFTAIIDNIITQVTTITA